MIDPLLIPLVLVFFDEFRRSRLHRNWTSRPRRQHGPCRRRLVTQVLDVPSLPRPQGWPARDRKVICARSSG